MEFQSAHARRVQDTIRRRTAFRAIAGIDYGNSSGRGDVALDHAMEQCGGTIDERMKGFGRLWLL